MKESKKESIIYEERYCHLWIQKEDISFYGEVPYSKFKKRKQESKEYQSHYSYEGVLHVEARRYWIVLTDSGVVKNITDITNSKNIYDTENETIVLSYTCPSPSNFDRCMERMNGELLLKLFKRLKSIGLMQEQTKEETPNFKPSKTYRDDIKGLYLIFDRKVVIPEGVRVIETKTSFILVYDNPYEELDSYHKYLIVGIYQEGSEEIITDKQILHKIV